MELKKQARLVYQVWWDNRAKMGESDLMEFLDQLVYPENQETIADIALMVCQARKENRVSQVRMVIKDPQGQMAV